MSKHFYLPFEKDGKFSYTKKAISALSEYEKYELSFHPERPKYLDYLSLFSDAEVVFEDDIFGSRLIQTHRASLDGNPVMLIGQQSGPSSDYKILKETLKDTDAVREWNHGMPVPYSYERAVKAIHLAEDENRTIIIFVDTPGADPTEQSEADGIAWRIGDTIHALADAKVPTMAVILNRACSGGAIALTGCDVVLAMEYSTYLVITPEACSSILFHTRSRANEAAEASQITSIEGLNHGIVDELIPEIKGPAHRFKDSALDSAKKIITKHLKSLVKQNGKSLFDRRINRWKKIGQWEETNEAHVEQIQTPVSRLPQKIENGYIKRHAKCYDGKGNHIYDPVRFSKLQSDNYVCETCGKRTLRPSAWDYLDWTIDDGSFSEHKETRLIIDKDILRFPDYSEKLESARKRTGLMSAMLTGYGTVLGEKIVICVTDFGFLGASYCMSSGEKIWRAAEQAIKQKIPMIIQAAGGGARMHEGCSSMVSIPKAHVAISRVERAGLPVITIITDPTLGGVAIGVASRGVRLFEKNAGHIGFSGKRVIEQFTGKETSQDFQSTDWLKKHGHANRIVAPKDLKEQIKQLIINH